MKEEYRKLLVKHMELLDKDTKLNQQYCKMAERFVKANEILIRLMKCYPAVVMECTSREELLEVSGHGGS